MISRSEAKLQAAWPFPASCAGDGQLSLDCGKVCLDPSNMLDKSEALITLWHARDLLSATHLPAGEEWLECVTGGIHRADSGKGG
jgi:hypothetical protein